MKDTSEILLTVLMPVYNSETFLEAAIDSIVNQTLKVFEFIIINDGSTDSSDKIIKSFQDPRIRYINNSHNKGIVATLNEGLKLSKGKYIARMDADDIARPERLSEQLAYMQTHPECKLCGSRAFGINARGDKLFSLNRPVNADQIKVFNLFRNAFIHPTVMADAQLIKEYAYHRDYNYAEDYFLFSQIAMNYPVTNLKSRLLNYRIHNDSITAKKKEEMIRSELKSIAYLLSFLFNQPNDKMLLLHHSILRPKNTSFSVIELETYLISISDANKERKVFNQSILDRQLQKEWHSILLRSRNHKSFTTFFSSRLFRLRNLNIEQLYKLMLIK